MIRYYSSHRVVDHRPTLGSMCRPRSAATSHHHQVSKVRPRSAGRTTVKSAAGGAGSFKGSEVNAQVYRTLSFKESFLDMEDVGYTRGKPNEDRDHRNEEQSHDREDKSFGGDGARHNNSRQPNGARQIEGEGEESDGILGGMLLDGGNDTDEGVQKLETPPPGIPDKTFLPNTIQEAYLHDARLSLESGESIKTAFLEKKHNKRQSLTGKTDKDWVKFSDLSAEHLAKALEEASEKHSHCSSGSGVEEWMKHPAAVEELGQEVGDTEIAPSESTHFSKQFFSLPYSLLSVGM